MITYEVKGNLFSGDLLEDLASRQGQTPDDFNLSPNIRISDEANRIFSVARAQWSNFQQIIGRLHPEQTGVSETRNHWIIPLLSLLGYELQYVRSETAGDVSFQISHRDVHRDGFPIHIEGFRQSLDENPDNRRGNRESAHVQMQEYLNYTEHLYGIITNGYKLRLLRDHHRLTGIQYLEWDLEQLMTENDLASFAMLYRMLHVSRIPQKQGEDSLLEQYHQHSVEEGHRVRDKLKAAVFTSLKELGNGFLLHPGNVELREKIRSGELSAIAYGQYLRTLVYRLLFLFVAEDRRLVFRPESDIGQQQLYRNYYSLHRLRTLAEEHYAANPRHSDVWEQLKVIFRFYEEDGVGEPLGIAPLGGELFAPEAIGELRHASIDNRAFLKALDLLSRFERDKGYRIRINYRRINVEEFGAVYESLLDLNPEIDLKVRNQPFQYINGDSRKGTGSYYTHQDLVKQLLKSALEPVVTERLASAVQGVSDPVEQKRRKEEALLALRVCDPACGSGHFLVAAARALATELAYIRAPRGASIDRYERPALRDVIEHCIYGVDLNPDAVELCRLVLWMEAHDAGKPLTYLDHKIRCGNSLVGWLGQIGHPEIPDGAFDPVKGEDRNTARTLKARNAVARSGTMGFAWEDPGAEQERRTDSFERLAEQPVTSLADYWRKKQTHKQWRDTKEVARQRMLLNIWTYAFFQDYSKNPETEVTQETINKYVGGEIQDDSQLLKQIEEEAKAARFFHWPLEYPDVFEAGGFDVLLGNPPWSQIMLKEKHFFSGRGKRNIVNASTAYARKELIAQLPSDDSDAIAFHAAKRRANSLGRYLRASAQYRYTSGGRVNTYSVFSERASLLVASHGRVGTIVPTGIATDHTNRHFFSNLIEENKLVSLFDFENRDRLFPEVAHTAKFCMLTLVGEGGVKYSEPQFAFFLCQVSDLNDVDRVVELRKDDFQRINPNTKTCPVFRTRIDAELTKQVYQRLSVLVDKPNQSNVWGLRFGTTYNMAADSGSFKSFSESEDKGLNVQGNHRIDPITGRVWSPLYEAKLFWHYNHRFASFELSKEQSSENTSVLVSKALRDPCLFMTPRYWIEQRTLRKDSNTNQRNLRWQIAFREITSCTNERTAVFSILPNFTIGNTATVVQVEGTAVDQVLFTANCSSLVFDYFCRQKVGGIHLNVFYFEQLPVVTQENYSEYDELFVVPRVLELTYTAWDLKYFADDVWRDAGEAVRELIRERWEYNKAIVHLQDDLEESFQRPDWVDGQEGEFPYPPFRWDEAHRHRVQCELDAFYAYKYGLSDEDLRYILDPQSVYGDDFPGETFRVLKEKEIRRYKEYRTGRLVLEAWENKPWERPEELADSESGLSKNTGQRDYVRIRATMPPVVARIISRNENPRHARLLGRTKTEKLLHLIEAEVDLDFGRLPEKHHFGPADLVALKEAVECGKAQQAFEEFPKNPKRPEEGYYYRKLERFSDALDQFENQYGAYRSRIDRIIDLFRDLDRKQTELVATVYATWNNLLLDGHQPDDILILNTSHQWSEAKEKNFDPKDFVEPLQWLREHDLLPAGKGKRVV